MASSAQLVEDLVAVLTGGITKVNWAVAAWYIAVKLYGWDSADEMAYDGRVLALYGPKPLAEVL